MRIRYALLFCLISTVAAAQENKITVSVSPASAPGQSVISISAIGDYRVTEVALVATDREGGVHALADVRSDAGASGSRPTLNGGKPLLVLTSHTAGLGGQFEGKVEFDSAALKQLECVYVKEDGSVLRRTLVSANSLAGAKFTVHVSPNLCTPFDLDCNNHCGVLTGACCRGQSTICADCVACKASCIASGETCQF